MGARVVDLNRRKFLGGLIAAPAVVKYGSLMPVRGIIMPVESVLGNWPYPNPNDAMALGLQSQQWANLYLAGGVIDFWNGEVTMTHNVDTSWR